MNPWQPDGWCQGAIDAEKSDSRNRSSTTGFSETHIMAIPGLNSRGAERGVFWQWEVLPRFESRFSVNLGYRHVLLWAILGCFFHIQICQTTAEANCRP